MAKLIKVSKPPHEEGTLKSAINKLKSFHNNRIDFDSVFFEEEPEGEFNDEEKTSYDYGSLEAEVLPWLYDEEGRMKPGARMASSGWKEFDIDVLDVGVDLESGEIDLLDIYDGPDPESEKLPPIPFNYEFKTLIDINNGLKTRGYVNLQGEYNNKPAEIEILGEVKKSFEGVLGLDGKAKITFAELEHHYSENFVLNIKRVKRKVSYDGHLELRVEGLSSEYEDLFDLSQNLKNVRESFQEYAPPDIILSYKPSANNSETLCDSICIY